MVCGCGCWLLVFGVRGGCGRLSVDVAGDLDLDLDFVIVALRSPPFFA